MKHKIWMLCLPAGVVLFLIGILFGANNSIGDFFKGFLEGAGAMLALIGALASICWAVRRKK